jgi:hypothetical protein
VVLVAYLLCFEMVLVSVSKIRFGVTASEIVDVGMPVHSTLVRPFLHLAHFHQYSLLFHVNQCFPSTCLPLRCLLCRH